MWLNTGQYVGLNKALRVYNKKIILQIISFESFACMLLMWGFFFLFTFFTVINSVHFSYLSGIFFPAEEFLSLNLHKSTE